MHQIQIILAVLGVSIIVWGIVVAVLLYIYRQTYVNYLSEQYLKDYSDEDTIPDDIAIKILGKLIRRVILIIFGIMMVEIAGFAILIVSNVI